MLKRFTILSLITLFILPALLSAHCQIPCGIYDDKVRIKLMKEHVKTIEKSVNQINALSNGTAKNNNQLVRWIMNKDDHANKLSEIVTYYFMAQRIKPVSQKNKRQYSHYKNRLEILHKILVHAMKAKQNDTLEHVKELEKLIHKFEEAYFHKHDSSGHE